MNALNQDRVIMTVEQAVDQQLFSPLDAELVYELQYAQMNTPRQQGHDISASACQSLRRQLKDLCKRRDYAASKGQRIKQENLNAQMHIVQAALEAAQQR